jgi:hypothetical protein
VSRLRDVSDLALRKHVELGRKLASLKTDFKAWASLANDDQSPLRLHRSQIAKVTGAFSALAAGLEQTMPSEAPAGCKPADLFLKEARNTEQMILVLHSVWAFFRKKLAQRLEPGFSRFLDAADELAWACCHPAFIAARRGPIEPPLVFLNGALSPFMVGRDDAYVPEDVPPRFMALTEFKDLVARLPIPIVGLPWAQVGHLPDTMSVAHEAGHVVEDDLALEKELDAAVIAVVPESEQTTWLRWRGEIFADLWACAALGPAYLSALCDFLAADPLREAQEKGQLDVYPTANLRVQLNLIALELAGFRGPDASPVTALRNVWGAPRNGEFSASAESVVKTILTTKLFGLGQQSVHDILKFDPQDFTAAVSAFSALQRGSRNLGTSSVRIVFAGVRQGYDANPVAWRDSDMAERVLSRFDRTRPEGTLLAVGFRSARDAIAAGNPPELVQELFAMLKKVVPGDS